MAAKEKSSSTAKKTSAGGSKSGNHSEHSSRATIDHEEIRRWAESRGGSPACVRGTGDKEDAGVIRIEFATGPEPSLQQIDWEEWFEKFDDNNLALVYQDKTAAGDPSRFNKLVSRDTVEHGKKTSSARG